MMRTAAIALVPLTVGTLAACGASTPATPTPSATDSPTVVSGSSGGLKVTPMLTAQKLGSLIQPDFARRTGSTVTEVRCVGDLQGVVGATDQCTVIDGSGHLTLLTVTTTSVEGSDIKFDYKSGQ